MLNRYIVVPFCASSKTDAAQKVINELVQNALDTGDWSTLADYEPTEAQINTALSKSSYKKVGNLSSAQLKQLSKAYNGDYIKYKGNDNMDEVEDASNASTDARKTEGNAADYLAANQNAADQINAYKQLMQSYNTLPNDYTAPAYTDVTNASVQSLQQLQNNLGSNINYDVNAIKGIYDDATRAAYEIEQQSGAERSYYQHLADAQNTALDTIRQQYGTAVAQGASKGMQAAQQLSAILGTSATANEEATQLAIDKQTRANEYAKQMAQNAKDSLQYSNQQQMDLASLSRQLYNDQIQAKTAELSYNQGINTDTANYLTGRNTALGSLQASLANTAAGIYNNNQSAIAQLQSAIENANATKYAADRQKTSTSKSVKTTT